MIGQRLSAYGQKSVWSKVSFGAEDERVRKIKLKFWYWAHDRAEALWHWIYYNRIPEGIEERKRQDEIYTSVNGAYHSFWVEWVNSKGEKVNPRRG